MQLNTLFVEMAESNEELLINLESPERNSNVVIHNHYLKNPLIPGPDLICKELETNNPFDVVAQSAENWDPFELVLHQSLQHFNKKDCNLENYDKLVDGEFSTSLGLDDNFRINRSNSVSNNVKFFPTTDKQYDRVDLDILNASSRSLDNSPSIREKIKRVVKKRVSRCIEKALNVNTSVSEHNKHENLSPRKVQDTLPPANLLINKFPKQKQIEAEKYGLKHFLEEAKQLSMMMHDMSVTDDGAVIPCKDQKLSQLNRMKNSISEAKVSSPNEDLMSIKPPWDGIDNDSSDSDNSIGLPKVKLFYVKKKEKDSKSEFNQEQLAHYKKRIRASIDGNMSCDEVSVTDGMASKPKEQSHEESSAHTCAPGFSELRTEMSEEPKEKESLVPNKPAIPGMNDLRLKKKVGNIFKKGPLKAIVPLQKMTKSIAEKMSPLKKSSPSYKNPGKNYGNSSLSSSLIQPVATSTPNSKNISNNKKTLETSIRSYPRPRLSRKDNDKSTVNYRRSVSLSAEARSNVPLPKQPFSSINPNDNQKWRRPHTAPSPNMRPTLKNSPKLKKNEARKPTGKLSSTDKENVIQRKILTTI